MMRRSKLARQEQCLRIYKDRSELILSDGVAQAFLEGAMSAEARLRYTHLTEELGSGFLRNQINQCRENPHVVRPDAIEEQYRVALEQMVEAVTSEVGRALIGLTILQLCVKSITPDQSVRLHKSGGGGGNFSWKEGISMRRLDSSYITPTLRAEGLLSLNADGFMMTRSLAENYPYSQFYKAAIRGARHQWLSVIEGLETGALQPLPALYLMLSLLLNRAEEFQRLTKEASTTLNTWISTKKPSRPQVSALITRHITESNYAARLMEISMHALMQSLQDCHILPDYQLLPLSQMRSANKKHGNIGDVELTLDGHIVEAWDAKFGISYLRDQLEELKEKLASHEHVAIAGFVTNDTPDLRSEILSRKRDIEDLFGARIEILDFEAWVSQQFKRARQKDTPMIAIAWLKAYTESLSQKRPEIAPIDEPCQAWLEALVHLLKVEQGSSSSHRVSRKSTRR